MVHSFEVQYTKQSYGLDRDNNTIVIWYFQHVSIVIALNLYCVVSDVVAMSYRRQYKLSIYLDFLENIWVLYRQIVRFQMMIKQFLKEIYFYITKNLRVCFQWRLQN